jgi:hypothetical protein
MKKILTIALIAASFVAAGTCSAETISAEQIKEKTKTCAACHGEDGNAAASALYPRLAGQYHDYLARALHEYKSGERQNAIMVPLAKAQRCGNPGPRRLLRRTARQTRRPVALPAGQLIGTRRSGPRVAGGATQRVYVSRCSQRTALVPSCPR